MDKVYKHQEVEQKWYELWEKNGFFNPDNLPAANKREPFTIMMPPPNATGILHAGHALFLTLEDIMIRFQRMRGRRALWLPGTDHAAIATQARVEKDIYKKEEKTRHDLGRVELLRRINKFVDEHRTIMVGQMRAMGSSSDWSREAFTLDEKRNRAVNEAFRRFYDLGLIYRGFRIVNWDPKLQTTVSDDEVDWKEETAPLYYLKYGPFTIATARPETKFGDKYVVMHPKDKRYTQYKHHQKIDVEWINDQVTATVIKDEVIDMDFGTGVMTITPWHDTTDFDIAKRHNLDKEQIIDLNGKLLPIAGEFVGMHIKKARPLIVEKLKNKGLIDKIDEQYTHNIAINSRGGGIIEPQILEQWFVAVNRTFILEKSSIKGIASGQEVTLKQLMQHVVKTKQIKFIPSRFEKNYFHWVDNLRDWCISRQIWYGHRVPVWYRGDEIAVGTIPSSDGWKQDEDTLDTWFSSGLWTFSTLGWPEQTEDLKTYHPTDVLETAYEILFFWVARMILMTTALLGAIPFHTVYLHGLVRDERRQKLSKSKADSADPLDLITQFGADALRMALVFGTAAGTDSVLSEDKIRGMRNFTNKLWNIARFLKMNLDLFSKSNLNITAMSKENTRKNLSNEDKKMLTQLGMLTRSVAKELETYRIASAAEKLYHFIWHEFADKFIEQSKEKLRSNNVEKLSILIYIYQSLLTMLHPFMPFITEEISSQISGGKNKPLIISSWPEEIRY